MGNKACCYNCVEICVAAKAPGSFGVGVDLQNDWLSLKFCLNAFSCTVCIASTGLYVWLLSFIFVLGSELSLTLIEELRIPAVLAWCPLNGRQGGTRTISDAGKRGLVILGIELPIFLMVRP